ncbi:MAG: mechanosensitive ion channel family protein [Opitutales bacterium]|jgi:small-conductance mechanosensitive channel|nr:mechanosensitive ion channel family protein [Opitutales bacterium]MDP4643262.1 mechanosensitive ion channel family protein [Opitutales bacterium]MDP4879319.1 mechanosensitive ion channel family protein [Opitutales bacterium]MDP4884780.1 mechanosensitive ion channel family protein [Opitutales bacterium]MDP5079371.1 mechanosensitive ion channel family protein [Opitutales bacterium]
MIHIPHLSDALNQIIVTAILICLILLFQLVSNRWINSRQFHSISYRRRWTVGLRNLRFLLLVIGLVLIWATELRTAAISAVAIMAALVIGTKELIMCLLGSVVKTGSNAFALGDRIQINDIEGDVIDQNLLSTQLQEVTDGQYTGRFITIPNSLFLNQAIRNSTVEGGGAVFGVLKIKLINTEDWDLHEHALLRAAEECCAANMEAIERVVTHLKKEGFDLPSTQPRTLLRIEDKDTTSITLRYPASAESKLRTEQSILRRYLQLMKEKGSPAEKKTEA